MNKTLLYRQDGYLIALLYLQEHSVEQLEEEIRKREQIGLKTILSFEELNADPGLLCMTGFIGEAQDVMWCIAMRKMGFGKGRIIRNLDRVAKRCPNTIEEAWQFRQENNEKLDGVLHDRHFEDGVPDERMPSRSVLEYIRIREEGLLHALDVAREKGRQGLKKMVTRTKFNKNMVLHENDHANDIARGLYNEARILEWLCSLHELEKFGDHRMNVCMDEFEKAYDRIMKGMEGYENYLDEIEQITGRRLAEKWLKEDSHYPKVKHKKKKPRKPKPDQKEKAGSGNAKTPEPALPPIEEPEDYTSFPCLRCISKKRCRLEGYKGECTCLALYKEVRRENVRKAANG